MSKLASDKNGRTIQALKPGTAQNVSIGAASVQSSAFGDDTRVIRVLATVAAWIDIGSNPTATTSKVRLAAGAAEYFRVDKNDKIAVIQDATGGTLNVVEAL